MLFVRRLSGSVSGPRVRPILWTDYALGGDPKRARQAAAVGMYDHRLIRSGDGGFSPGDALARHQGDRAFIEASLTAPFAGPTIVVTHHAPHARSVHAKYAGSVLSAAFASDLSETIERGRPDLWVHVHCHASSDYPIGATRVVCNPKGNGPRTRGGAVDNGEFKAELVVSF